MQPPDESRLEGPETVGDVRTVAEVLGALLPVQAPRGVLLFVGAHPGDVLIGASWLLRRSPGCHVVHVADAAPQLMRVDPAGLGPSGALPRPRQEESFRALSFVGLAREQLLSLGAPIQEASLSLVPLTEYFLALLKALRPALLVGHPYAGENPDRDAAAFISHAAVALMMRSGRTPPALLEMASTFLATPQAQPETAVFFTEAERAAKQRMLACYGGGQGRALPPPRERYRLAPHYDFTRPPRGGVLPYEVRGGMTGSHWRRLARQALEELKLPETPWH